MNMKQPATPFSFKKNTDVHALPEAVPPAQPLKAKKVAVAKDRQVSCYLSEEEHTALLKKLDGRPVAAVVRNLVLDYISHG